MTLEIQARRLRNAQVLGGVYVVDSTVPMGPTAPGNQASYGDTIRFPVQELDLGAGIIASYGVTPDILQLSVDPTYISTITGEAPSLIYHDVSDAGDNAEIIKAAAGTVTGWSVFNNAGYPIYVKLYDTPTAPTPSSEVPKKVIAVQAGLGSDLSLASGLTFSSGIGIAIVKGIGDSDDTRSFSTIVLWIFFTSSAQRRNECVRLEQ